MKVPRIAIPEPNSQDSEYSARSWPQYAQAVGVGRRRRSQGAALRFARYCRAIGRIV